MKRLIDLRKGHPAFSRGSLEFLHPDNRRILSFVRRHDTETILVVANLSRFVQHAELDLSGHEGRIPVEMFGRVEFPPVGQAPYFITLGPHEFIWFSVEAPADSEAIVSGAPRDLPRLPAVESVRDLVETHGDATVAVLTRWMLARRWFRGKARTIKSSGIRDTIGVPSGSHEAVVVLFEVEYTEGEPEVYVIPLAIRGASAGETLLAEQPAAGIAQVPPKRGRAQPGYLVDATALPDFASALLEAIRGRRRFKGAGGELAGRPFPALRTLGGAAGKALRATPIRSEQSNSSVVLGQRLILKLYRIISGGTNPDLEIGRYLTERGFDHVPAVAGAVDYRTPGAEPGTAAILQAFVPNQGDLFEYTLDALGGYFERAAAYVLPPGPTALGSAALLEAAYGDPPEVALDAIQSYLDTARLLGTRTGELHRVLAADGRDPAFAPEPFTELYQRSVYQAIHATARQSLRLLSRRMPSLDGPAAATAGEVLGVADEIDARLRALYRRKLDGERTRVHGDFHLGQVLHTGRDLLIIDFEGEPARPLGERRLKRSPLVDVAGMIRSFHYAAYGALMRTELGAPVRDEDAETLMPWVRYWYRWVSAAFLRGYLEATADASFLPADDADKAVLLDAFLIQKAGYELGYELNNRPDWVAIPLRGLLELLDR
jgi:maltose alpha-D-glucosyltransferase/alpha-amylase